MTSRWKHTSHTLCTVRQLPDTYSPQEYTVGSFPTLARVRLVDPQSHLP